jgi:hypothetical protein
MKKFSKKLKRPRLKKQAKPEAIPASAVPRITNDTVAEHREEVLSSARKYIYPLQHSKHKIVVLTISIVLVTLVAFFTYCTVALYRLQSTSTFLYKATQVVPFPIARQGGRFIAYENYLFEVRRYQHYYENQQKLDFNSDVGKQQLDEYKRRALDKVINDAYIKQIAKEKGITVSDREVEDQITLLREQERLGSSDDVLEDVLREYFGWSRSDFKRYARDNLLQQKVLESLDTNTKGRAEAALAEIKAGKDFKEAAKAYSDDVTTKDNGGEYDFTIEKTNKDLNPQTVKTIFSLKPGQVSEIINTGNSLEIYRLISLDGDKAKAAHIVFNLKDINDFLNDAKDQTPTRTYITPPEPKPTEVPIPAANN